MELCDRWGIPHSQFLGGDDTWTARDRAKARAYQQYRRTVCPQCGTREAEWDSDLGGDPEAYVASAHRCFGCEEIALKQREIPDGKEGAGMKVLLLPPQVVAALRLQKDQARRQQQAT